MNTLYNALMSESLPAVTLGDQIRAEVIASLPGQPSLFENIKPIEFAREFTAAGVLLANASENEQVYTNLMERLWDEAKDGKQLASTTNVFVAALKQLSNSEYDEASTRKRSRVVAEITPERLDRLRIVDRLYILAALAKTSNTSEAEVNYKINPKAYTDFVISRMPFLGVNDAIDAHTNVFANIIACQPYHEQDVDLAEVVDYMSFYFTSRSGRLNRRIDEEFGADKFEVNTDTPDEVELDRALRSMKFHEYYFGETIHALEKHPDLYIAFVQNLLDNGTGADTITGTIIEFPDDVDLNERLYDILQGYPAIGIQHAQSLAQALIAAGRFKKAYAIIEQHGALEDTDDTGPPLGDACFNDWGCIAARLVSEAEKQGDTQEIADALTQKILCNAQLSAIFSHNRRINRAQEILASGNAKGAMEAILDGNYSFAPSAAQYGWFGSEVITEKYGVELIEAAMAVPHDEDPCRDQLYKKWFLETVIRTLVRRELEVVLDAPYISTVKDRAARALDSLYGFATKDALHGITDDAATLYALAGEVSRALAFCIQGDGKITYQNKRQDGTITAALCSIALSGSVEGFESAMNIYKASAGEVLCGEKRLLTLLTAGALRNGTVDHLLTLEKTTPDYRWGEIITTAVQIVGGQTEALPNDLVSTVFGGILKRMRYKKPEYLASLVDPTYLYELHLSNIKA